MRNLIINNISIICNKVKKAKYCEFVKGINVITSPDKFNGNYIGKSSLIRCIYHTLGADGKFSDIWEQEGNYTYLVDLFFDRKKYYMLRYGSLFKFFDAEKKLLFKTANREELAEQLLSYFNNSIYLQGHNDKYSLAHPAYNYLLNYVEQKSIKACEFQNFNQLTAFKKTYSDIIYSHLGVNTNDLYNLKIKEFDAIELIKKFTEKDKIFKEILKEINSKKDTSILSTDIESLKIEIGKHETKYNELICKSSKLKNKIFELTNLKKEVKLLISEIKKSLDKNEKETEFLLSKHSCPYCKSTLNDSGEKYFETSDNINSDKLEILSIEEQLVKIERDLHSSMEKYNNLSQEIKLIERLIFNSGDDIEDKIVAIGAKKIKENIYEEISKNDFNLIAQEENKKNYHKQIILLEKSKKKIDDKYNIYLIELIKKNDLGILIKDAKSADDKIRVDGTKENLLLVAWLCSLLKVRYEFNQSFTIYPLIFDNPNNADFDDNYNNKIFNMIFDNLPNDGQIITSLVGFDKANFSDYTIDNIIVLENAENQLLNEKDYNFCKSKVDSFSDK